MFKTAGIAAFLTLLLAGPALAQNVAPEEPRRGGTLVVAMQSEPVHLDPAKVTTQNYVEWTMLMVEGLFHIDGDAVSQPHLVDTYEVSDDGLTYTFTLRDGVQFHNGETLSAEDAVASIGRWFNFGQGREVSDYTASVDVIDDLTFQMVLSEPFPLLIGYMSVPAGTGLYIYPKSVIDEVGLDDMVTAVGTGPFVFDRWQRGSVLRVVRNDNYAARSEPLSGYAGDRTPWLDAIEFRLIPDAAVRLAGVETGEFDVARGVVPDNYQMVLNNPNLRAVRYEAAPLFVQIDRSHGHSEGGWTGNQQFRQAVSLALDKDMLAASVGNPDFISAEDCNLAVPPIWRTDICQERYHAYDPERAREILEEIGYDGEELIFVTDPSRDYFFNPALITVQMLREVGINIEIVPVDAATMAEMREQPNTWDFISGGHAGKFDPTLWSPAQPDHFGWFGAYPEELQAILDELRLEPDFDTRVALWEQYTDFWYDWVPMIKVGDQYELHVENVAYSGLILTGSGNYVNHGGGWK